MRGKGRWVGLLVFLAAIWAVGMDLLTNATAGSFGDLTRHRTGLIAALAIATAMAGVVAVWRGRSSNQPERPGPGSSGTVISVTPSAVGMISLDPPADLADEQIRGRDAIIAELSSMYGYRARHTARVRVLYGLGGSGKTAVAGAAAHRLRKRRVEVWWISGATASDLQTGMRELARALGGSDQEIDRAWAGLSSATDLLWRLVKTRSKKWLLVIDNADDVRILAPQGETVAAMRGWIRPVPSRRGAIVVTSRDGDPTGWGSWCQLHPIGRLSNEDGARVLLDQAGSEPGGWYDAVALAAALGGLPLALRLAGRYLSSTNRVPLPDSIRTYTGYREAYSSGGAAAVFGAHDPTLTDVRARGIIDRTWELSLDLLDDRKLGAARTLLRLLACFADAPIPYDRLLDRRTIADSHLLTELDDAQLRELLNALSNLALIELRSRETPFVEQPLVLQLHPLVRDTGRGHVDRAGQTVAFLSLCVELLSLAATDEKSGRPEDPAGWASWRLLDPHLAYVFRQVSQTRNVGVDTFLRSAAAALRAVRHLTASGLYPAAEQACGEVVDAYTQQLGAEHPATLRARAQLASVIGESGQPEVARSALSALVPLFVAKLGETHPETLDVRAGLARWTGEVGNASAAQAQLAELVPLYAAAFGEEHVETLRIRANLASASSDSVAIRDQFTNLVTVYERVCGPEHPDTLRAQANLAEATGNAGAQAAACDRFAEVADRYERLYGRDHPDTLRARAAKARWAAVAGDEVPAHQTLSQLRPRFAALLGEGHPDTVEVDAVLAYLWASRQAGPQAAKVTPMATPILVTGTTGAGKTRLIEVWTRGDAAVLGRSIGPEVYRPSAGRWALRRFDRRLTVAVVPGVVSRARSEMLFRTTGPGRHPDGVIHVVCWGYEEPWSANTELVAESLGLDSPSLTAEQRLEKLRQRNLQEEVHEFEEVCDRLAVAWDGVSTRHEQPWLIIAITKSDLFWSHIEEAINHYSVDSSTPFGDVLKRLVVRIGRSIKVAVVPVSSGPIPFELHTKRGGSIRAEPELDASQSRVLLADLSTAVEELRHGRQPPVRHRKSLQRSSRRFWA